MLPQLVSSGGWDGGQPSLNWDKGLWSLMAREGLTRPR